MRYLIAAAVLGLAGSSFADIINVPADYATIQGAVDAAVNGDEIVVAPGTYTGGGNEVIHIHSKSIWLHSSGGPEVTIIDGQAARRGIDCHAVPAETTIEGFTVTGGTGNGQQHAYDGGGMYLIDSSPTIDNCIITNNNTWGRGGGLALFQSAPVIRNCTITNNTTSGSGNYRGGGLYCSWSSPTVQACTIADNSGYCGIELTYSNLTMSGCRVSGNGPVYGIRFYGNSGHLGIFDSCEFSNQSTAISTQGSSGYQSTFSNSIFCNNGTDFEGGWIDGGGNEFLDICDDQDGDGVSDGEDNCPLYNPDQVDCNENDVGDVCDVVDGTSNDIDGSGIPDECECLSDVTGDNTVNSTDLLIVIATWGTEGPSGDANYDGIVDIQDLLVVIDAWGPCP